MFYGKKQTQPSPTGRKVSALESRRLVPFDPIWPERCIWCFLLRHYGGSVL
ncbi:hypothetical protein Hanom_Chr02g00158501 [Helianthus anomalus]